MTAAENQPPPMTNKTAIQILRDEAKKEYELSGRIRLAWLLNKITELESTERQQLSKAFDEGADRIIPIEGSQYYEQTFGNSQNTQQ